MRCAILKLSDAKRFERRINSPVDLIPHQSELKRRKSNFIQNRCGEKLDIRILKDQSDAAAKCKVEFIVAQSFFSKRLAKCRNGAASGKIKTVEQIQESAFTASICA